MLRSLCHREHGWLFLSHNVEGAPIAGVRSPCGRVQHVELRVAHGICDCTYRTNAPPSFYLVVEALKQFPAVVGSGPSAADDDCRAGDEPGADETGNTCAG